MLWAPCRKSTEMEGSWVLVFLFVAFELWVLGSGFPFRCLPCREAGVTKVLGLRVC